MYPNNKVCYKLKIYPNPIRFIRIMETQPFALDLFKSYNKNKRLHAYLFSKQIHHIPFMHTCFL